MYKNFRFGLVLPQISPPTDVTAVRTTRAELFSETPSILLFFVAVLTICHELHQTPAVVTINTKLNTKSESMPDAKIETGPDNPAGTKPGNN